MNDGENGIRKEFLILSLIGTWVSTLYCFWILYVAFAMDESVTLSIVLLLAAVCALIGVKNAYHRKVASLSDNQQAIENLSSKFGVTSAFRALKWPTLSAAQARIRNLAIGVGILAVAAAIVSARFSDMVTSIMIFTIIAHIGWSVVAMVIVFRRH